MKTNSGVVSNTLQKDELNELLKETKETLATGILTSNRSARKFGIVDLWRMQKKHRTLGSSTKW